MELMMHFSNNQLVKIKHQMILHKEFLPFKITAPLMVSEYRRNYLLN